MKYKTLSFLQLNILAFLGLLLGLTSCQDDIEDLNTKSYPIGGMYICNEGPFLSGTGTIDYYSLDKHTLEKDIFLSRNGVPLGNIAQSMVRIGNTIYIVVNNSNKIEIVKADSFSSIGSIEGLTLPRYMLAVSDTKAYVSCWDNTIAIIDLTTNQVKGHITVGTGPEKMLKSGSDVFVLNQGGFSIDSTISIININTDQVVQTLAVYPKPSGIVKDEVSGAIWVMCSGKGYNGWPAADDSEGHLLKVEGSSSYVSTVDIMFPDKSIHPEKLILNSWRNELLYLYNSGIYKQGLSSAQLDTAVFVNKGIPFYGFGFDNQGSAEASLVVASDPVDYTQDGWVYMFSAADGHVVDSVRAGIIPTDFIFLR